jgi:integrase/recombinase XerC
VADFSRWLGLSAAEAVGTLLGNGPGPANQCGLAYRVGLADRGLAPSSINRRLASLRGLAALARSWGWLSWALDVPNLPAQQYRDTSGPGSDGWGRMLDVAESEAQGGTTQALRDLALVRLLFDLGLRRGEAVGLDVADLDLPGGRLSLIGKHRNQAEWLTVPDPTQSALEDWPRVCGLEAGPVFIRLDRGTADFRCLSGKSVRRIVRGLGGADRPGPSGPAPRAPPRFDHGRPGRQRRGRPGGGPVLPAQGPPDAGPLR